MINEFLLIYIFVFIIGTCIGSFLNVVALRGLSHESIVFPASKCPVCGEHIKWYDNIPIFSYLFTFRGKCRNCGCHVSLQYPIVEAVTGISFLWTFLFFGIRLETLFIWILLSISIVISVTDFKEKSILDIHLWILIFFSLLYSVLFQNWKNALLGLVVAVFVMEFLSRILYFFKSSDADDSDEVSEEHKFVAKNIHLWVILALSFAYNIYAGSSILNSILLLLTSLAVIVLSYISVNFLAGKFIKNVSKPAVNSVMNEEDKEIADYISKTKRAFGSGDTYVMAALGALLGWQYAIIGFFLAVLIQVVFIIPQFFIGIVKNAKTYLFSSVFAFLLFLIMQLFIISDVMYVNLFISYALLPVMLYFAIDVVLRIRETYINMEIKTMPFAPALLIAMFVVFFMRFFLMGLING